MFRLAFLLMLTATTAGAQNRKAPPPRACGLERRDSEYGTGTPLYRACAVDQAVKPLNEIRVAFSPTGTRACYCAEAEYVVDPTGKPEMKTARVIWTNSPAYAQALITALGEVKFRPATKSGVTVRQITSTTMSLQRSRGSGATVFRTRPTRCTR